MYKHATLTRSQTQCIKCTFFQVDLKQTGGEYNRNILHVLLEAPDHKKCKKEIFERCLHAILDCGEKRLGNIVNHKDALGFVPLHYATNYWNDHDEIIKKILLNGGMASIGIESELNPKFKDSEGELLKNKHHKVASSRPVYYSILNSLGQRSQYISIKFHLYKQYENPKMCY